MVIRALEWREIARNACRNGYIGADVMMACEDAFDGECLRLAEMILPIGYGIMAPEEHEVVLQAGRVARAEKWLRWAWDACKLTVYEAAMVRAFDEARDALHDERRKLAELVERASVRDDMEILDE